MKKSLYIIIIVIFTLILVSCNFQSNSDNNSQVDNSDNKSIIGNWTLINAPKGATVKITFHDNGTFYLINRPLPQPGVNNMKDVEGNWSKNGNKIYLSTPNENEVGIMEILSQDQNNLVIHMQGEPDKEINYFKKN